MVNQGRTYKSKTLRRIVHQIAVWNLDIDAARELAGGDS